MLHSQFLTNMELTTQILIGIAVLLLVVLIPLVYSGLLTSIDIKVTKPPFISSKLYLYKYFKGNYEDCGSAFKEVVKNFVESSTDSLVTGVYYDNPKKVPAGQRRYTVGLLLSQDSPSDMQIKERMLLAGYSQFQFPVVERGVVTIFPYRTMLSIYLAVGRVYPALGKYIEASKLHVSACLEVYVGSMIYFIAPLDRNEEFYVPESRSVL